METKICRTCGDPKPLEEEFWYHNIHNEDGFSNHCKDCDRKYYSRQKAKEKRKEILQAISDENETFGGFETQAMRERMERLESKNRPLISIYQEIGPPRTP